MPPLHVGFHRARRQIDAENVHRAVVPIALVERAIHQQTAFFVGVIRHDAGDRQMQLAARTGDVHDVAQLESAQHREVLRSQHGLAFGRQPKHFLGIAGHRRQRGMLAELTHIRRDEHGRLALNVNARVAYQLHFADARDRAELRTPSIRESENRAA